MGKMDVCVCVCVCVIERERDFVNVCMCVRNWPKWPEGFKCKMSGFEFTVNTRFQDQLKIYIFSFWKNTAKLSLELYRLRPLSNQL